MIPRIPTLIPHITIIPIIPLIQSPNSPIPTISDSVFPLHFPKL